MDYKEEFYRLIGLVTDMRYKQNRYFKCRSGINLNVAKRAEAEVDNYLKKHPTTKANEWKLKFIDENI